MKLAVSILEQILNSVFNSSLGHLKGMIKYKLFMKVLVLVM